MVCGEWFVVKLNSKLHSRPHVTYRHCYLQNTQWMLHFLKDKIKTKMHCALFNGSVKLSLIVSLRKVIKS